MAVLLAASKLPYTLIISQGAEYVAPSYPEPPQRQYPLGPLLAAAGYGTEAAAQLSEEAAAEEVLDVFKDSRKVRRALCPSSHLRDVLRAVTCPIIGR